MHTFLHKKFINNLKSNINNKEKLLIAISGGQDSLCLIKLLQDCFKNRNNKFEAIYIDYQWQKKSIKHTKQIINFAKQIEIKLSIYEIKSLIFSEKKARLLRYQMLINHALKYKFSKILLGHTKNDKIETFLQQLIRGTSIDGATGLVSKRKISKQLWIIRPMLHFSREETEWFCRKLHLPVWSDTTNYNYLIPRNRFRHELIPYLKQCINHNTMNSLYSFIELSETDNEYIKENTIRLYLKIKHKKLVGLNINLLQQEHLSLQQRSLQLFFQYHFNLCIKQQMISKIIKMINYNSKISNIFHTNNLVIQLKNHWLYANFVGNNKI
uniref:tRNA(Ile)-lysidine synthase n=1 Tax=Sporolithon durum TaxID=48970 RepID=A0A141SCY7_9FLOR|nr:tRNA(Ile)-lysidine synthase [Sporolithon durum]AMK96155.1 tRNA(Ile)-lysidine synthase [Sporolithon durum]